jgi:predicted Zn-dependent peptidase
MRSVSIGFWVGIGSRDETPDLSGASHFLEHLLFKGTKRRSALDISAAIEAVGGETNAFTSKECTCYYARVLDDDLPLAIDVLCDVISSSVLDHDHVETERGVILEEIAMHEDEPCDEVHDQFAKAIFGEHALGRLVSGTTETISTMTRKQIAGFYHRRYTAPEIVIAAAGNLDHATVVKLVRAALRGTALLGGDVQPVSVRSSDHLVRTLSGQLRVVHKDTEQAHLVLGCAAMTRFDERRFALRVLDNVLGGGMSSRLFQQIREQRGLAYSVYSYTTQYADTGLFAVYAGCTPSKASEVLAIVQDELAKVAEHGITSAELARGKGMFKGGFVLGLEDTGSRMTRLGKGELLHGELLSADDLLKRVDAVTLDEVCVVAAELLTRSMSLAAVGPFDGHEFSGVVRSS